MESERDSRLALSLQGLAVGDAFGQQFFALPPAYIAGRRLPAPPWRWTDDTHMAQSVVEVLTERGAIDGDALAQAFARRFAEEPWRGYAGGAARLLTRIAMGADWQVEAPSLFEGGSYGNGGAMRAAPIGAYFSADPQRAAAEAELSAAITHAHIEGKAGAVAVAVAAALAAACSGVDLIDAVQARLPECRTRAGLERSRGIEPAELERAYRELGTGEAVAAFDTAPLCVWMVAHHGDDFADAMWKTVAGLGDRDTTCAIVGGILGAAGKSPPDAWIAATEAWVP